MAYRWTCPHCNHHQIVTDATSSRCTEGFYTVESAIGYLGFSASLIVCVNPECKQPTITCSVVEARRKANGIVDIPSPHSVHFTRKLYPQGSAKPQPDFIPFALREDYYEACAILEQSPKAAATLARRCLQGMIRDFCEVKKGRLIDEIKELQKRVEDQRAPRGVTIESVEAIDHVRGIGNIGAHMEKDINLIVPVDPGEAQLLVDLVELLFAEWYIARKQREEKLGKIKTLADEKRALIDNAKAPIQIEPPKED